MAGQSITRRDKDLISRIFRDPESIESAEGIFAAWNTRGILVCHVILDSILERITTEGYEACDDEYWGGRGYEGWGKPVGNGRILVGLWYHPSWSFALGYRPVDAAEFSADLTRELRPKTQDILPDRYFKAYGVLPNKWFKANDYIDKYRLPLDPLKSKIIDYLVGFLRELEEAAKDVQG